MAAPLLQRSNSWPSLNPVSYNVEQSNTNENFNAANHILRDRAPSAEPTKSPKRQHSEDDDSAKKTMAERSLEVISDSSLVSEALKDHILTIYTVVLKIESVAELLITMQYGSLCDAHDDCRIKLKSISDSPVYQKLITYFLLNKEENLVFSEISEDIPDKIKTICEAASEHFTPILNSFKNEIHIAVDVIQKHREAISDIFVQDKYFSLWRKEQIAIQKYSSDLFSYDQDKTLPFPLEPACLLSPASFKKRSISLPFIARQYVLLNSEEEHFLGGYILNWEDRIKTLLQQFKDLSYAHRKISQIHLMPEMDFETSQLMPADTETSRLVKEGHNFTFMAIEILNGNRKTLLNPHD